MRFKKFWESVDDTIWGNIPHHNDPGVTYMSPQELYDKQPAHNKKLMAAQRIEDARYLENLKKSLGISGIKQPILLKPGMVIDDGLHRLIVALDLNLPQVPVKNV